MRALTVFFALHVNLMTFWSCNTFAQEEVLQWVSYATPPFEIASGPSANTGVLDVMRVKVEAHLPQYKHLPSMIVNQMRFERLVRTQNVCHAGAIRKPHREQAMYFSQAFSVVSPFTIVTTKAIQDRLLNGAKSLSLEDLLILDEVSIVLPARTLGPLVDPILKRKENKHKVRYRMGNTSGGEMFDMLIKGRADLTIAYPHETVYWQKKNSDFKQLVMIDIDELRDMVVKARVACSKNEWGLNIIRKINEFVLKARAEDDFHKSLTAKWLPEDYFQSQFYLHKRKLLSDSWSNAH